MAIMYLPKENVYLSETKLKAIPYCAATIYKL